MIGQAKSGVLWDTKRTLHMNQQENAVTDNGQAKSGRFWETKGTLSMHQQENPVIVRLLQSEP